MGSNTICYVDVIHKDMLDNFIDELSAKADPILLAREFTRIKLLRNTDKIAILAHHKQDIDRRALWKEILSKLPKEFPLLRFLEAMIKSGYGAFAAHLSQVLTKTVSSRADQERYMHCKMEAHNNLSNPQTYCESKSAMYKFLFVKEKEPNIKMKYADTYVSYLCAEISSHIMGYDNKVIFDFLLPQLEKLLQHTSNIHIGTLSYETHQVLVCSISERYDDAVKHIENGMLSALNVGFCVELVNFYYVKMFFLLAKCENCAFLDLRKDILMEAKNTLHLLQEEPNEKIRHFWNNMILLRMVFCLLGLSYKGKHIPWLHSTAQQIAEAKALMADINKNWESMEARQKMWYELAHAQLAKLDKDEESAVYLYDAALNHVKGDTEANYGETQFIKQEILANYEKIDETNVKETFDLLSTQNSSSRTLLDVYERRSKQEINPMILLHSNKATVEYQQGIDMPIINLHGHDTDPKTLY